MDLSNTQAGMSAPLRQCLEMSVMYGESHQLPGKLFGPDIVSRVVLGITVECPEKILDSPTTDILLVFASELDVNRVNPLTTEPKVNIISSSDMCFTVTWAIM